MGELLATIRISLGPNYGGYVAAGYVIAAAGLGGYFGHLLYRARRARAKARRIAARRTG